MMFVHDHLKVAAAPEDASHWLDANHDLVTRLVGESWAEHHGHLPPRLDLDGPFVDAIGQPSFSSSTVTFPLLWALSLPAGPLPLLSGDLTVGAYPDGGSIIELRGTCRELVGWLADDDNRAARPVMMQAVRWFLESIRRHLSPPVVAPT
jgi:hypothetical protein